MMFRKLTLQIEVLVPAVTTEADVSGAINAALDEPPCSWEDWEVGAAVIVACTKFERANDDDDEFQD